MVDSLWTPLEPLLAGWLATTIGYGPERVWYDADPPDDLGVRLPLIHLATFGGGGARPVLTTPSLDVDVYAATIEAAREVARDVFHALVVTLPGTHLGGADGVSVSQVGVMSLPHPVPYDQNDDIRRLTMALSPTVQASSA